MIARARAQTKVNLKSPSHTPHAQPTPPQPAMHGDDDYPVLYSTFDPALFDQLVYACVKRVPRGRVTTYGHIARLCHHPKHARHVGQALRRLPLNTRIPWQRIINASYAISSRGDGGSGAQQQAHRLKEEGVALTQDAMGVWKVWGAAAWETGGAQSLADLVEAGVEEEEEEEEEQGDEGDQEDGEEGGQREERKKKKSKKEKKKRKREIEEVVVKEEEEGKEGGVQ